MGSLGDLLRALREDTGLTQEELAERSGLSTRTVGDIERGVRKRLYPVTANRLAGALGLAGRDLDEFTEQAGGRAPGAPRELDAAFRRRFVAWHLGRVTDLTAHVGSEELWYAVLDADEANLSVALRWAEESCDTESLLALATGLWQYWLARGALRTGREWLERGLAAEPAACASTRARALWGLAWLAHQQGDDEAATAAAEELDRLADSTGDAMARRNAATVSGIVALAADRTDDALPDLERALGLARELDHAWLLATSLLNVGIAAIAAGDIDRATMLVGEALEDYDALGDSRFRARCLGYLGLAALVRGDAVRGRALFLQSMSGFEALGEPSGTAEALTGLATAAAMLGAGVRAAELAGAAERLREPFGLRALPVERRIADTWLEDARRQVPPERWSDAWTRGRALCLSDAIGLAREPDAQGTSTRSAPGTTSTVSGSGPIRSPSA